MAERAALQRQWLLCIIVGLLILILYIKLQSHFTSSKLKSSRNQTTHYVDVTVTIRASSPKDSHLEPSEEPGIMFVETSDRLEPSALTVCAIESAARANPRKRIYYFIKKFSDSLSAVNQPEYITLLSSIHNVTLLPLNLEELFKETPLLDWYEKVIPEEEMYWVHVLSDACRIALLWKYGGIYLDTDVISLKHLDFKNFTCEQSYNYANGAALGFSRKHSFIRECMINYVENYEGDKWGWQGPDLITRMLKKWCESEDINSFLDKDCKGINFFPKDWFYPIPYTDWKVYFESHEWEKNSSIEDRFLMSRGVHVWNFLSYGHATSIKESQSYVEYFFKKYCPKTYATLL